MMASHAVAGSTRHSIQNCMRAWPERIMPTWRVRHLKIGQAKAEKFLTCDYHGFGYLLDCGVNVLGQLTTIAGLLVM